MVTCSLSTTEKPQIFPTEFVVRFFLTSSSHFFHFPSHCSLRFVIVHSLVQFQVHTAQLIKEYTVFCGIRTYIILLTTVSLWSQMTPSPLSLTYSVIHSSHLHLGVPRCFFLSDFPTKLLCAFLISSMRTACPDHFIVLYLLILIMFGESTNRVLAKSAVFLASSQIP